MLALGGWNIIMGKSITPKQIKANNRQLIYDYIYENGKVSQQDISYALRLSRPTVASNLVALEADGLIYKNGMQDTELIGRKAVGYSIVADYRVAIGVEVRSRKLKMIAVDLYGKPVDFEEKGLPFEMSDEYCRRVSEEIRDFISRHDFRDEQVLGIGFAMQALISTDGTSIVYGAILNNTGFKVECFGRYLPYPCTFIHDPEGAALTEIWHSQRITNALYISLSQHLGGALIADGMIRGGKHGHNATFEHIQVRYGAEAKKCYCGRYGCLETVCSMSALLGDDQPEDFFEAVRSGEAGAVEKWNDYLGILSRMVNNLHLVLDVDVILGGHLAQFLTEQDVRFMYSVIREATPFDEEEDFILLSRMPRHNITVGAALTYIQAFLADIETRDTPSRLS